MSSAGANEMLLNDPPTDGISAVCFAPASDLLLASSWDSVSPRRKFGILDGVAGSTPVGLSRWLREQHWWSSGCRTKTYGVSHRQGVGARGSRLDLSFGCVYSRLFEEVSSCILVVYGGGGDGALSLSPHQLP